MERNAGLIAIGLIGLELAAPGLGILKVKFPGLGSILNKTGAGIANTTKDIYSNSRVLKTFGYVGVAGYKSAKAVYDIANRVVGRNFASTLEFKKVKVALNAATKAGATVDTIIQATNLTNYQVNRLFGRGVIQSLIFRKNNLILTKLFYMHILA